MNTPVADTKYKTGRSQQGNYAYGDIVKRKQAVQFRQRVNQPCTLEDGIS